MNLEKKENSELGFFFTGSVTSIIFLRQLCRYIHILTPQLGCISIIKQHCMTFSFRPEMRKSRKKKGKRTIDKVKIWKNKMNI